MKIASYYLETAPGKVDRLKEQAIARLVSVFKNQNCTQTELAGALGISQPRLSDALRGRYERFTLDRLYEMLCALGQQVQVEIEELPGQTGGGYVARKPEEAEALVAHYTAVIENDPADARAHARRGFAYMELEDPERAIADYTRAIELEPERPGYRTNRIVCYKNAGLLNTALYECERFEELFPQEGINQNKGLVLERMERYEEALECHHKAVEESPERPGPYSNRASLLRKMGRSLEALRDYKKAHELDPQNTSYLEKIAEIEAE